MDKQTTQGTETIDDFINEQLADAEVQMKASNEVSEYQRAAYWEGRKRALEDLRAFLEGVS